MLGHKEPIHSILEGRSELDEAIGAFVIALAERVDRLQDAESENDVALLETLAQDLAGEAEPLGYPQLAAVATNVRLACQAGKSDDAQAAVVELTEIARRIRLGHRGAA